MPGNWTVWQTLLLSCMKILHVATLPKITTGLDLYLSLLHLAKSLRSDCDPHSVMWQWNLMRQKKAWKKVFGDLAIYFQFQMWQISTSRAIEIVCSNISSQIYARWALSCKLAILAWLPVRVIFPQRVSVLHSSWTLGSTWAGRLQPSRLAHCKRSFCFRYSVRALGLWQYGWYVVTRAWEISQAYKVVQGSLKSLRNRTWLTQELRLRVWGQYWYRLK